MATVYTGPESSYTEAVTVVRQLENAIQNYDPDQYPLLSRVGLNSYPEEVYNTKIEWQRDEYMPIQDALNGAVSTTGATDISVDNAEYFAMNDVVLVEDELMLVVDVNTTDDEITVSRGFAGSTAATHSDADIVYRLGAARPEGSSPGWAQQVAVTQPFNYTQIWDAVVSITGTEDALKNYAPDDLMAYRLDKRLTELYQMMERALIYNSERYAGSASAGRLSAGLDFFVADKNDLSGAAITFEDIEDAMEDKFSEYGLVNVPQNLFCNSWVKRKITNWGLSSIRTERMENVVGSEITVIETDFGTLDINLDHLIKNDEAWLLNLDTIMMAPLRGRGLKEIDASVPGDDAMKHRVIGEYVFVVKGEDGSNDGLNVKIYGISTTS